MPLHFAGHRERMRDADEYGDGSDSELTISAAAVIFWRSMTMIRQELIQMLEQELSGERALESAARLTRFYRSPGASGYHRATDFVADLLRTNRTGQGMGGAVSPGQRDEIHECRHAPGMGADQRRTESRVPHG